MAFFQLAMNTFSCKLNMAGAIWNIEAAVPLQIDERYRPFLTSSASSDCQIQFRIGSPPIPENARLIQPDGFRIYRLPDGYVMDSGRTTSPVPRARVFWRDTEPLLVNGWIFPDAITYYTSLTHLLETIGATSILTALGAISLHSSFITSDGQAILFSAPSGTGKSTQAALWEQYAGAEQINGDRSVIRCVDGVWTAFGFPFAGSSGIYKNRSAPIRAIVVLRQAPENTIARLGASEAFRLLYSETAIQRWNTQGHAAAVDLLIRLSAAVPVYRLCCTPDERAVTLLQKTLVSQEASL